MAHVSHMHIYYILFKQWQNQPADQQTRLPFLRQKMHIIYYVRLIYLNDIDSDNINEAASPTEITT